MVHPLNGARTSEGVARATRLVARQLQDLGHHVEELVVDPGLSWAGFVEMNAYFLATSTAGWIEALAAATTRPINGTTLEPAALALHTLGRELKALDLLGAISQRNDVIRHLGHFFSRYDLLLTPTLPALPMAIASHPHGQEHLSGLEWVEQIFNQSPFTTLANVTGTPAMSVPLTVDAETGLPIGSHFMAGWDREDLLFRVAGQLERAMPWATRRPPLTIG